MITRHLKTGVETNLETSRILNINQTMDNIQHSIPIMNQPLSQNFRAVVPKRCVGRDHEVCPEIKKKYLN
jgi:hypothetical protein